MSAEIEVPVVVPTSSVRKALCGAQRDVGGIGKNETAKIVGKNKEGGRVEYSYQFISTEDMLAHCREALIANGLSWELIGWDVIGALPGFNVPTLVGTFELCHGESGEVLTRIYKMPIASRNDADKATAGAITYLLGQATRALLLVPKVSDNDAKNDPDKRTTEHGGWHDRDEPRSQRTVTPAPRQQPADATNEKALNEAIRRCVELVRGYLPEVSFADLVKQAGITASPTKLTADQKQIFLRSLEQKMKTLEAADDPT